MKDGFPLLTTKKMAFKTIVTELLWFLRGDTNIRYLVDNNCHIWDGDAYKNYCKHFMDEYLEKNKLGESYRNSLRPYPIEEFINKIKTDDEFAKQWGDLGKIYGSQWRSWGTVDVDWGKNGITGYRKVDQIANSINLLKTDPDSRRNRVNAWNVGELDQMVLPPCHTDFQFFTRELSDKERIEWMGGKIQEKYPALVEQQIKHCDEHNVPKRAISLMWNQRSCDFPLGIPMNIASYALLLMMIADEVNMIPDELIGNLGDCHIYLNQVDGVKEQINREPYPLPIVHVRDGIFCSSVNDVILENYQSHPKIYFPLSN